MWTFDTQLRQIATIAVVGRTPSSAPDPLVRLFDHNPKADGGVGRGPGVRPTLFAGDFEDFEYGTAVGIGNRSERILMASISSRRPIETLADALEILAFFGMRDEEAVSICKHARRRAFSPVREGIRHEGFVGPVHMQAAVVKDVKWKLNSPIEHVNRLAWNIRKTADSG